MTNRYGSSMPQETINHKRRTTRRHLVLLLLGFATLRCATAQNTPMVSGGVGFFQGTNRGPTSFSPTVMPVLVAPIGPHFLFETRDYLLEEVTPRTDGKSDQTKLFEGVSYLQLNYIATSKATFVAGKFLTPFATYNERLTPIWIGNFQDNPLIFPIGNIGSTGTGGEVRGSLHSSERVNIDYTAFFSANVTAKQFQSSRAAGGRVNAYFPSMRLEVGVSYDRMFEGTHRGGRGVHVWWEPQKFPLTIRSEYAREAHAQGYWIETGYRLSQINGPTSLIGRLEPLFRMQQTFRNSPDPTDGLPGVDTKKADFGLDYFLPHEVRINTSYTRQFSSTATGNIWKTGLVYRFMFPAWPGKR
jgi:hypothetical protein